MNIYWESFKTFFKIGIFTLGGGYAMIPLIEEEVVGKKQWVSKDEMLDLIAIAQSCPGVFAINIATFIGYKLRKTRGAICTTLGTALPSFLIILAIAIFFSQFKDNPYVAAIFRGIRPAVVALIAVPTFRLGQRAKRGTDCCTNLPSWAASQTQLVHNLDSRRMCSCNLGTRRITYLYYIDCWYRRLSVWHVH